MNNWKLLTIIDKRVATKVAMGGTDGSTEWLNSWTKPPVILATEECLSMRFNRVPGRKIIM